MRITVIVKPGASVNKVIERGDGLYTVFTTENAEAGKANKSTIKLLAKYFSVGSTMVRIVLGQTSKEKLIEVEGLE